MSLPKKRKKLEDNWGVRINDVDPCNLGYQTNERAQPNDQTEQYSKTEQMANAFKLVAHIEDIQEKKGSEDFPTINKMSNYSPDVKSLTNSERVAVKVSYNSEHPDQHDSITSLKDHNASSPIIEIKFKLPSIVWRVPVLNVITKTILKRISK